jgi:O-antigen/teichoic acid export membrane protein
MRKRTRGTVAHWFAIVVLLVFGLAMAMLAILDPGDGSHGLLLSALTFAFAFAVFYAMKRNQWVSRVQQTLRCPDRAAALAIAPGRAIARRRT